MSNEAPTPKVKHKPLSVQMRQFMTEYVKDWKGKAAAIRAGYSENSAADSAWRLLQHPEIAAYVERKREALLKKFELSSERTQHAMASVAYFDPRQLFNPDGTVRDINELDDATAASIAGIDVEETFEGTGKDRVWTGRIKRIRLVNRVAALDMVAKVTGEYKADNEQKAGRGLSDIERAVRFAALLRTNPEIAKRLAAALVTEGEADAAPAPTLQ